MLTSILRRFTRASGVALVNSLLGKWLEKGIKFSVKFRFGGPDVEMDIDKGVSHGLDKKSDRASCGETPEREGGGRANESRPV